MASQLDLLKIGSTQETLITLRSLGFDYSPRTHYQPYARLLDPPTGSGRCVRRGKPRARWTFAGLTNALMSVLADYLGDSETAWVYVTTLENDGATYSTFHALMRIAERTWASGEEWIDISIEFTRLEAV